MMNGWTWNENRKCWEHGSDFIYQINEGVNRGFMIAPNGGLVLGVFKTFERAEQAIRELVV